MGLESGATACIRMKFIFPCASRIRDLGLSGIKDL